MVILFLLIRSQLSEKKARESLKALKESQEREKQQKRELSDTRRMAYKDPLTGVKSKRAFAEMQEEMDGKISRGEEERFAVLVCDVNGLKYVNDTQGHMAGDRFIQEASRLICTSFKHSPVYRIGGDEFVVLLNGQDYPERKALVTSFDRKNEENLKNGKVVVASGLSEYDPGKDGDFHTVFERADNLMYERKKILKSRN